MNRPSLFGTALLARVAGATLATTLAAGSASAVSVLVLSSGNATLDAAYVSTLTALGHNVSIGPQWHLITNGAGFPNPGVVLFLNNANWSAAGTMPAGAQGALVSYILQGGGMVTTEWTMWRNGNGLGSVFPILADSFASLPSNGVYRATSTATYNRVTPDPIMDAGMPASITFVPDDFSGTESRLAPRPGATEFYSSDGYGSGIVGWPFGNGRTVNISTCVGQLQLGNANFARLFSNALTWAASAPGCPADFDDGSGGGIRDGAVGIEDLLYYLDRFAEGSLRADLDDGSNTGTHDGGVTIEDLLYFLDHFATGC
jgi:hypothetical protein